jgi:hypothetical protein
MSGPCWTFTASTSSGCPREFSLSAIQTHTALPFGFICPDAVKAGDISLAILLAAVLRDDRETLATMRAQAEGDAAAYDTFIRAARSLVECDHASAAREFASVQAPDWKIAASILRAIALAAGGELRQAIALANQTGDVIRASGSAGAKTYWADLAMLAEAGRCIQAAEARHPAPVGPVQIASPLRYLIGYPRSGNSLLTQFLSFAFAAPNYSVYPASGWYFSRRFYERAPGHPVFVKDHILQPEYLDHEILSPVRDGRNATISLARYLYAQGKSPFVRRGELADFISHAAAHFEYGFWGDHTRRLLEASDQGARIRWLRYEEIFRNYGRLVELAEDLAGAEPVPCLDQGAYLAFVEWWQRRLRRQPQWSEELPLPADSFIPQKWSIGGDTIDWRRAFDLPARRRFHELGGTEMLIRLGYETDEDWWRRE